MLEICTIFWPFELEIFCKVHHKDICKDLLGIFLLFKPPSYAQNLYDAVMFLAIAINDTISKGQNYKSGAAILKNMENKSFASKIIRYTPKA